MRAGFLSLTAQNGEGECGLVPERQSWNVDMNGGKVTRCHALSMALTLMDIEASVANYSVDIWAEDNSRTLTEPPFLTDFPKGLLSLSLLEASHGWECTGRPARSDQIKRGGRHPAGHRTRGFAARGAPGGLDMPGPGPKASGGRPLSPIRALGAQEKGMGPEGWGAPSLPCLLWW